jgi:glutaredoxin
MKRCLWFVLLLLLTASVVASAEQWKFDESKIHFYMYGVATCPHCQRMKKLIPETYGYDKFTYYELLNNDHNGEVFSKIARLIGITGVPTIGIVYNGTLVAIIEGEFNVSATPKIVMAAIENKGTILFVGGKTYILPWNNTNATKIIKELKGYFMSGEPTKLKTSTSKRKSTTTSSNITGSSEESSSTENKTGICGPVTVVALSLLPTVAKAKKRKR